MAEHGYWMNTDETVWDAKEIDGKQQLEISIVSARCSVCERWAEQINQMPPYMHYDFCPHCGAIMDAKPKKRVKKPEPPEREATGGAEIRARDDDYAEF